MVFLESSPEDKEKYLDFFRRLDTLQYNFMVYTDYVLLKYDTHIVPIDLLYFIMSFCIDYIIITVH